MEKSFFENYKHMIDIHGLHERMMVNYIKKQAIEKGFVEYKDYCNYKHGDKIFYVFRDKLIILMKLGLDFKGANMIVSHLDSPRLDVIVGNPVLEKDDGTFLKVIPYGGIISQSWLDRPLVLVGRVEDKDGKVIDINTKIDGYHFVISSLLPHLDGRKEMKELKYENLLVRIGNKKENILKILQDKYNLADNFLELADLSFVPSDDLREIGFDKDLITGYGHDDKCCAYAELQAFFDAELKDMSQVAIFASYEETGSRQSTGCQTDVIEDFFVDVMQSVRTAKAFMRNSFMISADVCAGYEHQYDKHFENSAKAIVGKGTAVVPYLGRKSGNDSSFEIRKFIKELLIKNEIDYSIETTKVSEGGGGTVSSFFAVKGCEIIDVGIPVLAMHSPQELISKHDLYETYRLYKVFYESR